MWVLPPSLGFPIYRYWRADEGIIRWIALKVNIKLEKSSLMLVFSALSGILWLEVAMLIQERIRYLIAQKNLTLRQFHKKLKDAFKGKAISYVHLTRIVNPGNTTEKLIREATLFQLAYCLNMNLRELKEGTTLEEDFHRFNYNDNAYLDIFSMKMSYLPARLVIKGGARTPVEQDPPGEMKYEKWVYCVSGEVTIRLLIDEVHETYMEKSLEKESNFVFDSRHRHFYENTGKKTTTCIVIQNPKYV
jgi:hypothetical protein